MTDVSKSSGKKEPWLTAERLGAITDGVIAIIITILVLQINVPEQHDFGVEGVFSLMKKVSRDIMVYLLSFCLIGTFWLQHHVIFHYVKRVNRTIVYLNGVFLFFLSLSPFSTQLAGAYPGVRPAEVFFGFNFLLSGLSLFVLWRYAARTEKLLDKPIDITVVRSMGRRIMVEPALIIVGMVISVFNFHAAALVYFIAPLFYLKHWLADTS